jgi:hypothetical protein
MPLIQVTSRHLLAPRRNLEGWVLEQARLVQAEHGFGYVPTETAPSTFPGLMMAYETSASTGVPYPVSSEHCDQTIFSCPETNWAMRYVHDLEHANRQLSFSTEDELALGEAHLEALRTAGFDRDSFEYKLLLADTIGQARCVADLGRFPHNQRLFAYDCIDLGVDAAIELEAISSPEQ